MLLDKSLEELDGIDWGEPDPPWSLAVDCHRLRRLALKDFTDFDLARMIRQKIDLDWLVPVALVRLLDEPDAGELYDGETMTAVMKLPSEFWNGHPDLARSLDLVVKSALARLPEYTELYGELEADTAKLLHDYKRS